MEKQALSKPHHIRRGLRASQHARITGKMSAERQQRLKVYIIRQDKMLSRDKHMREISTKSEV